MAIYSGFSYSKCWFSMVMNGYAFSPGSSSPLSDKRRKVTRTGDVASEGEKVWHDGGTGMILDTELIQCPRFAEVYLINVDLIYSLIAFRSLWFVLPPTTEIFKRCDRRKRTMCWTRKRTALDSFSQGYTQKPHGTVQIIIWICRQQIYIYTYIYNILYILKKSCALTPQFGRYLLYRVNSIA